MTIDLPAWLSEWEGAEAVAASIDMATLRANAQDLVSYVLAEDTCVLDSLPEAIESALITPIAILGRVCDENRSTVELVVAARLVRRSAAGLFAQCSSELLAKLLRLPE